jgi:hypothetical protein
VVRAGAGKQEDGLADLAVSTLQCDAPLYGLKIGQPGLRLDAQSILAETEYRVPSPKVADCADWHFRPPREGGRNLSSETVEQCRLRLVAQRSAGRIRACRELEPGHAQQIA